MRCDGSSSKIAVVRSRARATRPLQIIWPGKPKLSLSPVSRETALDEAAEELAAVREDEIARLWVVRALSRRDVFDRAAAVDHFAATASAGSVPGSLRL